VTRDTIATGPQRSFDESGVLRCSLSDPANRQKRNLAAPIEDQCGKTII
jgi:hypothetical protein